MGVTRCHSGEWKQNFHRPHLVCCSQRKICVDDELANHCPRSSHVPFQCSLSVNLQFRSKAWHMKLLSAVSCFAPLTLAQEQRYQVKHKSTLFSLSVLRKTKISWHQSSPCSFLPNKFFWREVSSKAGGRATKVGATIKKKGATMKKKGYMITFSVRFIKIGCNRQLPPVTFWKWICLPLLCVRTGPILASL